MGVFMNQTNTTGPTEGCVDQDSRPPAFRYITSTSSALSELFLSDNGLLAGRVSRVFTLVCLLAKRQPRRIGRLFTLALLLVSSVLMGAVPAHAGTTISAQAPDEIIEAIMGGGTVIGTECVNGKVVELVSSDAIIDFGPDLTLFVKPEGKTRLRKDAGYKWVNGTGDSNKDKVNFIRVDTGKAEGVAHYLSSETAANEVAEFGTSVGGPAAVIPGQGTHQMQFASQTGGTITLGTMYTAELVWVDG